MFCEKCGTRVEDGEPFCPNCGNRMKSSATPRPAPQPQTPAPAPGKPAGNRDPLALVDQNLPLLRYGLLGLLALCFLLSLLRVFSVYGTSLGLNYGAPWLLVLGNVLYSLCFAALALELSGKSRFCSRPLFTAGTALVLLLLYVLKWIVGYQGFGIHLTLAGWLYLLLQLALCVLSVLLVLRDK